MLDGKSVSWVDERSYERIYRQLGIKGPRRVGLVRRFRAKDGSPHVCQNRADMGRPAFGVMLDRGCPTEEASIDETAFS